MAPEKKVYPVLAVSFAPLCETPKRETLSLVNLSVADAAERFFHEQIPLTRAMGVHVVACDDRAFVVEAPVALNHNHLHTAFGGSVNAVATVAAYGLLWAELREQPAQIVVAESAIRFRRPIRETIRAVCSRPPDERLNAFIAALRETGKARIRLAVLVEENGVITAEFDGQFVASRANA